MTAQEPAPRRDEKSTPKAKGQNKPKQKGAVKPLASKSSDQPQDTVPTGGQTSLPQSERDALAFTTDQGAGRSTWIAAVLVILIVGWMGSGFILPSEKEDVVVMREELAPIAVAIETSTAETVPQYYQAEGQALPDRDTALRAETSGDIAEVFVQKGDDVDVGTVIARFDSAANEADTNRALQELSRAQREFDNAEQLLERGVATADRVSQARATLAAAQAQVTDAQEAAKSLTIAAPFAGRIETLDLDEGEYVSAGANVGRLVDITPLTVAIQVPQQSLTRLRVGQPATVRFITGEEQIGEVTFVGTSAASETRTFLAEIEVPNADGAIPAGISAEVVIPTGEVTAHFLAPSIVSLDTEGTLGVKVADENNVVVFYPIQVVIAQIDGIWVTGLPDTVDLITIGQGFVNAGETVAPSKTEK